MTRAQRCVAVQLRVRQESNRRSRLWWLRLTRRLWRTDATVRVRVMALVALGIVGIVGIVGIERRKSCAGREESIRVRVHGRKRPGVIVLCGGCHGDILLIDVNAFGNIHRVKGI